MSDHLPLNQNAHKRLSLVIAKTVAWEEAKGKLRSVVALSGIYDNTDRTKYERYKEIQKHVEDFIKDFEGKAYDEP